MRSARLLTAPALIAVALAALIWAHAAGPAPTLAQDTVTVTVGDFFFCGPALPGAGCNTAVKQGDTVLWDYTAGSAQHTVTHCGDSCDSPTSAPLFDSQPLSPGQSFSFTFSVPGTYLYRCRIHPQAMRAQVLVVSPEATVPATPIATSPALGPTVIRAPSPAEKPTPAPTAAPSASPAPSGAPVASSAAQASPAAPASPAVREGDDGGTSAWVYIIAGLAAAAVIAAAGALALRRLRRP